jgi:MYXO-CTERM domain-containing protein
MLNLTVDDGDPSITYSGTWSSATGTSWDQNGTCHWSSTDSNASATFIFTGAGLLISSVFKCMSYRDSTGVAIYYWSPKWPYSAAILPDLDEGNINEIVDLQDHAASLMANGSPTVKSQVIWGKTSLKNTTHKLRASLAPNGDGVSVDAFTYTVLNSTDPVPTSTSASTSSSSAKIAVPVVLGVFALGVIALGLYLLRRRRRRSELSPQIGAEVKDIIPFTTRTPNPPNPRRMKGRRNRAPVDPTLGEGTSAPPLYSPPT